MTRQSGLLAQMLGFVGYLARTSPLFYVVIALSIGVLFLEFAATSLMIPMAPSQGGSGALIASKWNQVAEAIHMQPTFRTWLWIFFLLMCLRLLLGYVLTVLTTVLGKRVHRNLSEKIFGHILLSEPMAQVYVRSVGHYITLAGDDTFKSGTIVSALLQTMVGFLTALLGLLVLYQFSPLLFSGVMAFLAVSLVLIGVLMRIVIRLNLKATTLAREASTTFIEALNSLRSIRSLRGERFVMATYAAQIHSYIKTLVEMDAIKTGVKAFPAIALLLLAAIVLRPGADVYMTDAALFAGTIIIIRVFASLGLMVTAGSLLLTEIRAVKDISALVQHAQERWGPASGAASDRVQTLDLQHVSFGYGDRGRVLDDVTFRFEAGHTYAVVGPSGAGKSTLADILLGLSVPESGEVVLNEGRGAVEAARTHFMLVEQQPKIFSTTVRENLLLGAQASDEDLYAALESVNLDGLIRSLNDGLDTKLSYLGENFSGGQRQRLGIARALIRKPEVLLLDEATSALDPLTRVEVVAKLRARMREGIIIFITHDPEIAALADEVLPIGRPLADVAAATGRMD